VDDLIRRARSQPVICVEPVADDGRSEAFLSNDRDVASVQRHDGALHVMLHDPRQHHHELIARLCAAGIPLNSVAPQQLKLEDVFLRLTKGQVQ
jgi:hypothetical protein